MLFRLAAVAFAGLFAASSSTPANAANILVVTGTDTAAIEAGNQLNTDLSGSNTVTVVNTGVPGSLAGYTQIYDTRYDNHPNFSAGEMSQYLAFLNAAPGNTLFLMGENESFNVRNTPVLQFVALAGGGAITAPAQTVNGPEVVNPPFTGPNVISTITYAACGLVSSAGTGSFATQQTGGGCAIFWDEGTLANAPTGALVVVFDVNFIATAPTGPAINEIPFRLNLEQFAAAPPPATIVTAISPSGGSTVGGTQVSITGVHFTGATAVKFGAISATSFTVNSDTSITAVSPPEALGVFNVTVTGPGGPSSIVAADQFTVAAPAVPLTTVPTPTLGEWGLIALAGLLGCAGYVGLRKAAARGAAA
jgi:IPT/TIG domain-containing protein/exosortase sorting signal-containing protein